MGIRLLLWVGIPLLVAVLVIAATIGFFHTDFGRNVIVAQVERIASSEDRKLNVSAMNGSLLSGFSFESINVANEGGEWLAIKNLSVEWSPLQFMLGRGLRISKLEADSISLFSLPVSSQTSSIGNSISHPDSTQTSSVGEPFSLPASVQLDEISISKIQLPEALIGIDAVLSLEGRASVPQHLDDVLADFSIDWLDGVGGSMRFISAFNQSDQNLTLDLELEENAGGVVANFFKLREKPPLNLSVEGDGVLKDWSGRLQLTANNETVVAGTVETKNVGNAVELGASLDAGIEHLVPLELAELFKGALSLELQTSTENGGTTEIRKFEIASDSVNARVSGLVDSHGVPEKLEVEATANSPLDPILSLIGLEVLGSSTVNAKLDFHKQEEAYQWNLTGDIGEFDWFDNSVERVSLSATGGFPFGSESNVSTIPLKVDFDFESPKFSNSEVQQIVGDSLELSADGFFSTDGSIGVETGELTNWLGNFDFSLGFDSGILTVNAQTEESEFMNIFELIDFQIGGEADLAANVKVDFLESQFAVELESKTNGIELGIEQLDSFLTGQGKLKGKGNGNFELDEFSIAEFNLDTSNMELGVHGDYKEGELELNVATEIVDMESIAPELTGGLKVSGIVSGGLDSPHLDLALSSEKISVIGNQLEHLTAELNLIADIANPKGNLVISGERMGKLFEASATLAGINDRRYDFDSIKISGANSELHGDAEVSNQGIIEGKMNLFSSDIRELAEIFAIDAGGVLDAEIEFSHNNERQEITVEATGDGLNTANAWVENVALEWSIPDIRDLSLMHGQLTAKNVKVMDQVIESVEGSVKQTGGKPEFSVNARVLDTDIEFGGALALEPDAIDIDLNTSLIEHKSQKLTLAEQVGIRFQNGIVETGVARWQSEFGEIRVSGKSDEKFKVNLDDVSLSAVNMFFPNLNLEGAFTGESELDFSKEEMHVSWNASVTRASSQILDQYGLQQFSMLGNGEVVGNDVNYYFQITNEQDVNFESEGSLNLNEMEVKASLFGKVPMQIANVAPEVISFGIGLEGIVTMDLTASGELTSPELEGTISVEKGAVNHNQYGIRMSAINMEANFDGKHLNIESFSGKFEEEGALELTGRISVDAASSFPLNLELKGAIPLAIANVLPRIVERGINLQGNLMVDVSITGKTLAPDISGSFAISEGNFEFSEYGIQLSEFKMQSNYSNQKLSIVEMTGRLNENGVLELQGDVDIVPDDSFPSNLVLKGEIPMEIVNHLPVVASQGISFGGNSVVELILAGKIQSPEMNGRITITDGTFSHSVQDIHFSEIMVEAGIENNRLSIETMTGRMGKEGSIEITGYVDLDSAESFPASLGITISEGAIVRDQLVSMTFDSELNIDGPLLTEPNMVGKLDISQMEVQIPERLPGGFSDIEVTHVSAPESVINQDWIVSGKSADDRMTPPFSAQLDIEIIAPQSGFLIRGRGVLAEMGGDIKVTGSSNELAVNGAFTMIRGRLFILGKNLVFERGVVTFTGNFNPELDFLSTTSAPEVAITVGVAGVASDPEFTFSSAPELPQDEIMALLLFNRRLDQLSSVQIATLASQVASLTSNLPVGLGSVRSSLGIDVLDLTTDQQGNAAVEVGKYINENIYLGVSRAEDTNSVTVDIDITNNLKGRGELDESGTSKLGLEFYYDY